MDCSFENYSFKTEPEIDGESSNGESKKQTKYNWTAENTAKLIDVFEKDCRELWDGKNPFYRDRVKRSVKQEYLADMFGTTVEEINRKLHNLRSQFNNELRKIKKRRKTAGGSAEESLAGGSGWEHFDSLSFLMPDSFSMDPLEIDSVNIALAEFQAHEEEEFGAAARQHQFASAITTTTASSSNQSPRRTRSSPRVAASGPPLIPPHPMVWAEEPVPRIRPGGNADECQIFGDFVASELRTLRSDESRKRLKRLIQKAILQIGEEEDDSMTG